MELNRPSLDLMLTYHRSKGYFLWVFLMILDQQNNGCGALFGKSMSTTICHGAIFRGMLKEISQETNGHHLVGGLNPSEKYESQLG